MKSVAALFLVVTLSTPGAFGDDVTAKSAAEEIFRMVTAAVSARDVAGALASYDSSDAALTAQARSTVQTWLSLDALSVKYRVARIVAKGKTADAVVFRDVRFAEHGRSRAERQWETVRIRRSADGWKIVSEDERPYMRCDTTDLHVTLSPDAGTMSGTATLHFHATAPGENTILMQLNRGLDVTALTDAAKRPLRFQREADSIVIPLPHALRTGDKRTLTIAFAGKLFNESKEQGFSQVSIAPAGSFASWVTNWYPRLQGSGSKSKGTITYIVPHGVTVASSGSPTKVDHDGTVHEFTIDRPLDFSFAAAKYFHRQTSIDGVRLGIFLLSGGESKADLYVKECARILRYEQELYGRYPFDTYAVVEIPPDEVGGLGGSSEQGMNLFPVGVLRDDGFPLLLIAHEMGHSWWGNLVKADAAVLDEGLAQTTAAMCLRKFQGEKAMRQFLVSGMPHYRQSASLYFVRFAGSGRDSALGTEPVGSDASAAQHDIADTKGMFVYNMLRERIGDDAFIGGLRQIVRTFAGRDLKLTDLRDAWERSSGTDLHPFFQQWFYRAGAPDLALESTTVSDDKGYVTSGTISQTGDLYDVAVEVVLASPRKRIVQTVSVSGPLTPFSFVSDAAPKFVVLDPEYKVLRWTPAFKNYPLLADATGLASTGEYEKAIAKLEDFVAKAPESVEGWYRLGVCYEESGQFDRASSCFQRVLDRYQALDVYASAVALSELHLGQVADLEGRRSDATAAYRQALAFPDESDSHRDAEAGLAAPYKLPVRKTGPSAETMERYAGTYDDEKGMTFDVTVAGGVVSIAWPGTPAAPMQWVDGSRFRVPGTSEAFVEFVGAEKVDELDLKVGARVTRFLRRK